MACTCPAPATCLSSHPPGPEVSPAVAPPLQRQPRSSRPHAHAGLQPYPFLPGPAPLGAAAGDTPPGCMQPCLLFGVYSPSHSRVTLHGAKSQITGTHILASATCAGVVDHGPAIHISDGHICSSVWILVSYGGKAWTACAVSAVLVCENFLQ